MSFPADCTRYEAAIADLSDRLLPPEEEAALRAHLLECPACAALLAEAERGHAWARILHEAPLAPPADLLDKVLARTPAPLPGLRPAGTVPHPAFLPVAGFAQARTLLTAATAVFSLALTASVSGVHPRDLAPARVEAAASRTFYGAKKQVVSFYDNLRVLRELESTVEALRKTAEPAQAAPSAQRATGAPLLALAQQSERTQP